MNRYSKLMVLCLICLLAAQPVGFAQRSGRGNTSMMKKLMQAQTQQAEAQQKAAQEAAARQAAIEKHKREVHASASKARHDKEDQDREALIARRKAAPDQTNSPPKAAAQSKPASGNK